MLRELIHLARHAPKTLALKRRLSQVELYDTVMRDADDAGFRERRAWLAGDARGEVLEIGCGTGFMFEHYLPAHARVRAIDIDDDFLERAISRSGRYPNIIEIAKGDAQSLTFPDASFDAVVACLVFCSIPDAARALAEAHRVLRPGGSLRLIEHIASDHPIERTLMHLADPLWLHLNEQGCHMNRSTIDTVRSIFVDVTIHERFQIFSSTLPAFPMVSLVARKG
jgi:ubiquinone/menaquinone biosynthesis C-methylase UbiE